MILLLVIDMNDYVGVIRVKRRRDRREERGLTLAGGVQTFYPLHICPMRKQAKHVPLSLRFTSPPLPF